MSERSPGFLAAHAARGDRSLLRLGLFLAAIGAGLSWVFGNPYGFLFIGTPGVVVLGFWARRKGRGLDRHPVVTQLARYGDARARAAEVDREFAEAPVDERPHLGRRWLAQGDPYGVHLVPWRAVAWIYLIEQRRNGVLVANKVQVWTTDRRGFGVPTVRDPSEQRRLLADLHAHAPWAEVGFTHEREQEWSRQRESVIARVEARRDAVAA